MPGPHVSSSFSSLEHGWCRVSALGDYVLVSEPDTATIYRWSTRSAIRSCWTQAMHYGCALALLADCPLLVAFGDPVASAWDILSGALRWQRSGYGIASDVVALPSPGAVRIGATRVKKFGGSRFRLDLATGDEVVEPKSTSRAGRYLASDLDRRRYALVEGDRVVVREEGGAECTLPWKAHRDGRTVEEQADGALVSTTRFGDNEGLFAFGDAELLAVDTPDVIRYDAAGNPLSSWRMPDTERVVDVARHGGRWVLLVRRWPTSARVGLGQYDVRALEDAAPARVVLSDCDGIGFVHGHVLTSSLELVPLDSERQRDRFVAPPAHAFQQAVLHPSRAERRARGWKSEWSADPNDRSPKEQRAAHVRRQLSLADEAAPPRPREPGPLSLSPELADTLLRLRLLDGGGPEPVLSLSDLRSTEEKLGRALDDEIVTMLASRVAHLEREWELLVAKVSTTHALGAKVVPEGLRPFARAAGRRLWLCARGDGEHTRLYLFDERRKESIGPFEPVEWLTRELAHARDLVKQRWLRGETQAGDLLRLEQLHTPTRFVPSLVAGATISTKPRVVHAKFGVGELIGEEGHGDAKKLTVQFEDGTRRVLFARYLKVE